ncbi:ninein-like protein isoform X2 [Nothobranchius furzeri]
MEEEEEHSRYVAQLKAEFDSCDTTATGFLDRDELTVLCRKLQLDAHLALLLDTLLGPQTYGRVNFEEFKEGFISVLSRSLDFSTSEDNSSYLEPAIPEEVKPKFIKGTKCYGRRSHPDGKPDGVLTRDQDDSPLSRTETADPSPPSVRRAKLRRATSLESVESLKFDEEAGSHRKPFQNKGCPQEQEEEVGGGGPVLTALCDHLGLQDVDVLLRTVAPDLDQAGVLSEVQKVLCSYAPKSNSTPIRSANLQRTPLRSSMQAQEVLEEPLARSASPSLLMATVGQRVLSRLDDGSGCTSPEQVVALWTEEGIHNSREILQTLDFTLEERLSLSDLTLALDNELLVSGNGIHQVALISYKNEIQHLLEMSERACRERDKLKTDLDLADQRNLQLIREVDDHHTNMETMNESRIRDMEQDFRERLMSLRCQSVEESEVLLRQVELERHILMEELQLLRVKDTELQEELSNITQEKVRLEEELDAVNVKLRDAESSVIRLQGDLKQLLQDKFGSLDPTGTYLSHEQKFSTIIKEYELQCRELQDRNDELSSELDLLKIQRSSRRSERSAGNDVSASELSWSLQHIESESDDSDMKQSSSPAVRKRLQPVDKIALSSLDDISVPAVSIQTELAVEQLKEKHQQEVQQLNIQLETQINYYERQLDMMKQSMEVERKDISQAFKLEISELEEQKSRAEQQVKQLKGTVDKLQTQIQQGAGGGARSMEQERKMHRERAELEQNFAREISNLVQRLSDEKEQLEAELKLKMDQEVMRVREESRLLHAQVQQQQHTHAQHLLHQLQEQLRLSREEKKRVEEELRQLKEQVCGLQELLRRCSQSEATLEEDLKASQRRSLELEENNTYLESPEVLNKRLFSERISMEEELQDGMRREEELQAQVDQLKMEPGDLSASLRSELEKLQEVLKRLTAEVKSLKADRARLIQDLKDQAMAVDGLQLQLTSVSKEVDRRRSSEATLQEDLKQKQNRISQLWSSLTEEREVVTRLSQENSTYTCLLDQLSTQIMEMEEEISSLHEQLKGLSSQLNDTADLVLDLRRQLNSKTSELDWLRADIAGRVSSETQNTELDRVREQVLLLQQALQDSQNQLRTTEEIFDREKRKMAQQLMELERLVLDLEDVMEPDAPHRTQLEEVRLENGALQERLRVLQQEVQNLDDEVAKKRRRLEEMEREHERSRKEEERLQKENFKYREEVLDLSSRNLQLSSDNGDLSAHLCEEQESVQMLQKHLATVSKEQPEEGATFQVQRLMEEKLQQQSVWLQQQEARLKEQQLLEKELISCKEKLSCQSQLEAELRSVMGKLLKVEEEKDLLQRDAKEQNHKVNSLQEEVERLQSELLVITQEKVSHAQEVLELYSKLSEAENQVVQLEANFQKLLKKEELHQELQETQEQASITLQEQIHRMKVQNQELQQQVSKLQVQEVQVQKLTQELHTLKSRLMDVEAALTQAQDQAVRADTALSVAKAQHLRQVQQLQQQAGCGEQVEVLQAQLEAEMKRSQQLEEVAKLQVQQSGSQIIMKQQFDKATVALQQRVEELEAQLKALRLVLQEKINQLKEQLVKNNRTSEMMKDLYVENSQLMKALQVTELRQKEAEKKNLLFEEKVRVLNQLLREAVATVLAT